MEVQGEQPGTEEEIMSRLRGLAQEYGGKVVRTILRQAPQITAVPKSTALVPVEMKNHAKEAAPQEICNKFHKVVGYQAPTTVYFKGGD